MAPWVLSGYIHIIPPQLIQEHISVPENVFSQAVAFQEENGTLPIGGDAIFGNNYHIPIVRQKLTGSLPRILYSMVEELEVAFKEEWEQPWMQKRDTDGWVEMPIFEEAMKIVSRTSNRIFGGAEICMKDTYAWLGRRGSN